MSLFLGIPAFLNGNRFFAEYIGALNCWCWEMPIRGEGKAVGCAFE